MKRTLIITVSTILICLGVTGCQSCESRRQKKEKASMAEMHNARNTLDYTGNYVREFTDPYGFRVTTSITLNSDGFEKTTVSENPNPYEAMEGETLVVGTYTWDKAGNIVTLIGSDRPNRYFVTEGKLILLDEDGNKMEDFVFTKQ